MPFRPANTRKEVEYSRQREGAQGQHMLPSELSILERRPLGLRRVGGWKAGWGGKEQNI